MKRQSSRAARAKVLEPNSDDICDPKICPLIQEIRRVGSPWNLVVAAYLEAGPKRFNEILRKGRHEGLNSRTLSRALGRLTRAGFTRRRVLGTQPIAVEYSLTAEGQRLTRILDAYREL
jgi:DNA-binding HxlR family transcriptional regulator